FFFQAEDGIRDKLVTGVQTCALPISLLNFSGYRNFMGTLQYANDILYLPDGKIILPQTISMRRSRFIQDGLHERVGFANYNRFRSEERRVGKECRAWRSRDG